MDPSGVIQRYHSTECSAVFYPPSDTDNKTFDGIGPALEYLADGAGVFELKELIIHRPAGDLFVNGQDLRQLLDAHISDTPKPV